MVPHPRPNDPALRKSLEASLGPSCPSQGWVADPTMLPGQKQSRYVQHRSFAWNKTRGSDPSTSSRLQIKVEQVKSRIQATQSQLDGELRTTRNLAILAPFRRSTRDRISFPVPSLARKIRTLRLELARFRCYEEILEKDLRVEEDEWQLVRHMCFGAATQRESQPYDRKSSLPTEI